MRTQVVTNLSQVAPTGLTNYWTVFVCFVDVSTNVHPLREIPTVNFVFIQHLRASMSTVIPPTKRQCERCGRSEVWDEDQSTWVVAVENGTKEPGQPHCLHEWDINGSYNPFEGHS